MKFLKLVQVRHYLTSIPLYVAAVLSAFLQSIMISLDVFVKIIETTSCLKNLPPRIYDNMMTNRCTPEINSCPEIPWIYGTVFVTIGFILLTLALTATLNWFVRKQCATVGYNVKNIAVPASDLVDMTHSIQQDNTVLHKETVLQNEISSPHVHHGPTPSNIVIANPLAEDEEDGIYEELGSPKMRDHDHSDYITGCFTKEDVREPGLVPGWTSRESEKRESDYIDGVNTDDLHRMSRITWDSGCDTLNVTAAGFPTPPSDFYLD